MITVGQIIPGSPLGEFLKAEAAKAEVIVEVGAGSALGSTTCLAEGMPMTSDLITIEADPRQAEVAARNIAELIHRTGKRITLHRGVLSRGILPYWHPNDVPQTREMWEHENKLTASAPLVDVGYGEIDLLFLDGGEFTTSMDFAVLGGRAMVVVLDDIHPEKAVKNRDAHEVLKAAPDFEMIRCELDDRNGWSCFRRK